jgi:hypothetical protein
MPEMPPTEMVDPEHPVAKLATMLSSEALVLSAAAGLSRWELCMALANACGHILAAAGKPAPDLPPGITMPKRGKALSPEDAMQRIDALHEIMRRAYELHDVRRPN